MGEVSKGIAPCTLEAPSTTRFAFFYGIPRLKNFVAPCDAWGVVCKVHSAISYVVTLFKVTGVRWRCCAISYVVTLFKVTRVRCKTLEGV